MTVLPTAVAVRLVMAEDPPKLSMPDALFVRPPVPASAVAMMSVPLLVKVTPVTVTLGIMKLPVRACELLLKVCMPELAVKVPLLVMPLLKVGAMAAPSFQVAPLLMVTKPVNVLAGMVAEEKDNVPEVPAPTVVVPVTPNVKAPTVKAVPSPMDRFPLTVRLAPVVAVALPLNVRFPATVVIAPNVSAPPLNVKWW